MGKQNDQAPSHLSCRQSFRERLTVPFYNIEIRAENIQTSLVTIETMTSYTIMVQSWYSFARIRRLQTQWNRMISAH